MFRFLVPFLLLMACGCGSTRTSWNALGTYQAGLAFVDTTLTTVTGSVSPSDGVTRFSRTRMCDIDDLSIGLPFNPVRGQPAAVRILLEERLCNEGSHPVVGGSVLVWDHPGADTMVVTGVPAAGWTVEGTVTISEFIDFDPPDPELNETVLSERVIGSFYLEVHGPAGERILFRDGTFQLEIKVTKSPYDPFD